MEQFYNENMYIIDLSQVDTTQDIIFQLSSLLDNDEAKNKRICLKLGNVELNQAQILSIKSLINGIGSSLSSIDTLSVETEKVALSLGIIISNVSAENSLQIIPEAPYKLAEELKEELNQEQLSQDNNETVENNQDSIEEDNIVENIEEDNKEHSENNIVSEIEQTNKFEEAVEQKEETEINSDSNNEKQNVIVEDELDVIFNSSPAKNTFYEMESSQPVYEEKEELSEIIVPKEEYTKEDIELETFPTKYIKQVIRSGQVINYEGNIVIIGDCHPGCEITAFGDITIWGVLSGIAHAGSGGNQKARVRALKMNAIQLRIANCYSRRPDSLNSVYIEKTNSFTPEEARIINGEIVVFKIND